MFNPTGKPRICKLIKNFFFIAVILSSCTVVRKYPKNKPFLVNNTIDIKDGNFNNDEKIATKQRLIGQLDDSSKVIVKDAFFFFHFIEKPPAYDTGYSAVSARSMKASMLHIGYYKSNVAFQPDTVRLGKQRRVTVKYTVDPGPPTLIDTVAYSLNKPELQQLAIQTKPKSYLVAGKPINKTDVLNETGRLTDLFRNNGYYKFTADDIRVQGDTTIAALTNVSEDPFENLKLIAEANEQRNKPIIKLNIINNPVADSNHLKKYYVGNIYVYPDYNENDTTNSPADTIKEENVYIILYHKKLYRNSFIVRNIYFKKGAVYSQDNYSKTINSFSKAGVWQNVNIQVIEPKDSSRKLDIIIQLLPAKKFGFEASGEASYSTNSAANTALVPSSGDLLGLAGDLSLENRNVRKEAIKMTNTLHAGVEINMSELNTGQNIINSNELGFTNTISFPRILLPTLPLIKNIIKNNPEIQQSFINTSVSYINRIALFNLQNFTLALGWQWGSHAKNYVFKPLNVEFSYLYNETDSFQTILAENPYLRYSFNTALVVGTAFSYSSIHINPNHINRQRNFKLNAEESGYPMAIPIGPLGAFSNYMRQFGKVDGEYTYTVSYSKSSVVFHGFAGVGMPWSSRDSSLPFFKQYYSGGSNSMRGWPIRGIGIGGQSLAPYGDTTFTDRTGDIKLEGNFEYRYNIVQLIPGSLTLKGALFVDAGNIWDFKNTTPGNNADSLQFNFSNLYKQLGVDVGTGFRFDFNYFLIRFDLGFRVKRPDILANDGWQLPAISFDNLFKSGVNVVNSSGQVINDERYREWRYENFNFTIGIGMPF